MIDDLFEGIIGRIGRFIVYILVEFFFDLCCYYVGYPIVKIITFGRYPVKDESTLLQSETQQGYFVSFVGLLVIIVTAVIAYSVISR